MIPRPVYLKINGFDCANDLIGLDEA